MGYSFSVNLEHCDPVPNKQSLFTKDGKIVKRDPEERWRDIVLERFIAFRRSEEKKILTSKGLSIIYRILGRRRRLTAEEWWQTSLKRRASKAYRDWQGECQENGLRFGLAPSTIELACLLKDYSPDNSSLVLEARWPKIEVVTGSMNDEFLTRLVQEAQLLGLHVISGLGSLPASTISAMPPAHSAFVVRVEIPIGYPPEGAVHLQNKANRLQRELQRRLGYQIKERIRASRIINQADKLKIGRQIKDGDIYMISDKVFGIDESMQHDSRRRATIKSRRSRLKKLLVDPYRHQGRLKPQ